MNQLRQLRIDHEHQGWILQHPNHLPFVDKVFETFGDAQDFAASKGYEALLNVTTRTH